MCMVLKLYRVDVYGLLWIDLMWMESMWMELMWMMSSLMNLIVDTTDFDQGDPSIATGVAKYKSIVLALLAEKIARYHIPGMVIQQTTMYITVPFPIMILT